MRIPVKHVTPALLVFLLLAACGRQKVTFRSMAGDKPVGTEVQANSSGDGTTGAVTPPEVAKVGTCTMVLERSEIDLGASPKVKVSLPDSKELSSLAINGEAADVSAAEHELTAVTASGSAKIIAVAIDKENRSYMCTAGLTVKTPVSSGLSLVSPTCSLVPESLSVKSGEETKLRITLANLDATKFKLNSASLSKSGDLDAVVLESLPVTRATGALPAGRHGRLARGAPRLDRPRAVRVGLGRSRQFPDDAVQRRGAFPPAAGSPAPCHLFAFPQSFADLSRR